MPEPATGAHRGEFLWRVVFQAVLVVVAVVGIIHELSLPEPREVVLGAFTSMLSIAGGKQAHDRGEGEK